MRRDIACAQQSLSGDQAAVAERLLIDWTRHLAEPATDPADRQQAERALQSVDGGVADPQGLRAGLRPVLKFLSRIRVFANMGERLAGQVLRTASAQVSRNLTDDVLRAQVQLAAPLKTLITMGSPLGLADRNDF
jgi:hypothetical protein